MAHSRRSAALAFTLLAAGTVVGLAGIDLVLPAIPGLPDALGGTSSKAQLVLASYVAGTAAGLLLFGALGAKVDRRKLLIGSLVFFATVSLACTQSPTIEILIALRFLQGLASSAPAVFVTGVIRAHYDEGGATKAIGLLGSIESMVPAGAPVLGVWLLGFGGWTVSFWLTAGLAAIVAIGIAAAGNLFPNAEDGFRGGSYRRLFKSPVYWRYAVSHALVLGGLLVFVLGAPTVIVKSLGGSLTDFIVMQVLGVACFVVAANLTGFLVDRFGAERMIMLGSVMAGASALLLLGYGLWGGTNMYVLTALFVPMNTGLGLRGPPGFLRAVIAGDGDNDRATSVAVLAITLAISAGTAIVAPFIDYGLPALCLAVAVMQIVAVIVLMALPRLPD